MATEITKPMRPDEAVAEVLALLEVGHSSAQVSARTGVPASTVRDYSRSSALVAKYGVAIKAARERIAFRWGQIVEDVLDEIEDADSDVKVSPVQAMTGWGIATDKVQRESSPSKSAGFVIVKSSDGTEIQVGLQSG